MPMVELTTTRGALDEATTQRLAAELSTLVLVLEAAPLADFGDAPHMQALSWCFVNEQDVSLGGQVHEKPIYRVTVTVPEGAPGLFGPLAEGNRRKLVERATRPSSRPRARRTPRSRRIGSGSICARSPMSTGAAAVRSSPCRTWPTTA